MHISHLLGIDTKSIINAHLIQQSCQQSHIQWFLGYYFQGQSDYREAHPYVSRARDKERARFKKKKKIWRKFRKSRNP
jgi:hypothetical protein